MPITQAKKSARTAVAWVSHGPWRCGFLRSDGDFFAEVARVTSWWPADLSVVPTTILNAAPPTAREAPAPNRSRTSAKHAQRKDHHRIHVELLNL